MKSLVEIFGEAILIATFQQRGPQPRYRSPGEESFDAGHWNESRWPAWRAGDAASGLCPASRLLERS